VHTSSPWRRMSVVEGTADLARLRDILAGGRVLVLSGAGLSTESGIPDYRGPRPPHARRPDPMPWARFRDSAAARRRYWARSYLGWPRFQLARPNAGHHAVAALQRSRLVSGVVTQNVDGLHQATGTSDVVDLHGRLDRVRCLDCGATSGRDAVQELLRDLNGGWTATTGEWLPDGDVELSAAVLESFRTADCATCGGVLKPDVVFFGETIPAASTAAADAAVDRAASLLVLGSSLTVFSGRRLVMRAARAGHPISVVNRGPTRADDLAAVKVDATLGSTLSALLEDLGLAATAPPFR
jgi:NAD-dependent SIR2 family protein deacetylase